MNTEEPISTAETAAPKIAAPAEHAIDAVRSDPRPEHIPEQFWDASTGSVRIDDLARSYAELQGKLGQMVPLPQGSDEEETRQRLLAVLGCPATAADYQLRTPDDVITADPEVNQRLHAAGFTQEQAQLVYDLAVEKLLPMLGEVTAEAEIRQQQEQLARHFGGEGAWRETARQLKTWAEAKLEPSTYATLAQTSQGVIAMHQMMRASEPKLLQDVDGSGDGLDEKALHRMVGDPRYWEKRDPEFIARVTEGFRKLFAA